MIYIFDNTPLSLLFRNMYRGRFRTLWELYDGMVEEGRILSTREVYRELIDGPDPALREWAAAKLEFFTIPTAAEGTFVARIYAVPHFQQNIEQKKLLKGGKNADAFVIAKAAVVAGTVVTLEAFKENATKIPNMCRHFEVPCLTLEEFMEAEGWEF
jgi:hypothetical protein